VLQDDIRRPSRWMGGDDSRTDMLKTSWNCHSQAILFAYHFADGV
jgi:hypothetical protein